MSGLVEYFTLVVEDGIMVNDPWPYLVFADFLPSHRYDNLLEDWPTDNWQELVYPDQLKDDGHYRRKQQTLDFQFPEIDEALRSDEFGMALFAKCGHPYPDPVYPMPLLIDDDPGYWIRPHVDVATKYATMQIYLPPDDSFILMGTRMMPQPPNERPASQVKFLPNTGYAFKNAPGRLHEVHPGKCKHQRRSIQVIWYNSPNPGIRYV